MAQVSFICKRTVVSTKPVQPGKFSHLSVLDRIMEPNHIRIVLYYDHPAGRVAGELTQKLRESLSEVLSSFQIVTGRLVKAPEGHWMIKCNDAGTRTIEARAKGSVVQWLQNVDREKELELVHWEDMFHKPYFWSTFYVQITEFEEGGLAIGLSCTHLLADPICATMILKAWADTTLGGKMTSPPLFHPLPLRRTININPNHRLYAELINHYKNSVEKQCKCTGQPQNVTTVTLSFSHEMVTACMAMQRSGHEGQTLTLTPFEALAGLFWVVINNVKRPKCRLKNMFICLDMRKVLGLDKGFFGNCMIYNKVDFEKGFDQNDLSKPALAVREVVRKMDFEGIMDLVEYLELNDMYRSSCCDHGHGLMRCDGLICVNLEDVEAYNARFDDEICKPVRVSYYVEPAVGEGKVLILPLPEGGRRDFSRMVMVTLPGDEAAKMCEDALLMQFSPTILMGAS